jgi:phage tail-like protein
MPATKSAAPAAAQVPDPLRAYSFTLNIQGVVQGHFTAVSGLQIDIRPIKYREAGNAQIVHHLPGLVDYGLVELRFGLTTSREMFDWLMTGVRGAVERKNVSIIALDNAGVNHVTQWDLSNAWVSRWSGAPMDALSSQVAVESMALAFDGLARV